MEKLEKRMFSLKKNFSWTLLGNGIYAFSQWYIIFLLAKLGSPEMVGIYSLGLAIAAPVFMLTGLQLRMILATDSKKPRDFGIYFGTRIIFTTLALVILFVIIYIQTSNEIELSVLLVIIFWRATDTLSDIVYGLSQRHERMDLIAKSRIIKSITIMLFFTLSITIYNSLLLGSLTILTVSILSFIFIDIKVARKYGSIRPIFNITEHIKLFKVALPLGIVLMFASLNTNLPKYFIEFEFGVEELGYFTAIAYFLSAAQTVITALTQSAAPRLSKLYSKGNIGGFRSLLLKLIYLGLVLSSLFILVSIFSGEFLLSLLYHPTYSVYNTLFIILAFSSLFVFIGSFLGCALTSIGRYRVQPYIEGVSVLIITLSSIILIPKFGLNGAGIAILTSLFIQMVLKYFALKLYLKNNKKWVR